MAEALALPVNDTVPNMILDRSPELLSTLDVERKLIGDLIQTLLRQRDAVSNDDIAAIDESVFSAQRILLTLSHARLRRRTLLQLMTGEEDVPLGSYEEALGASATIGLLRARDELQKAADTMGHVLEVNRRILSGAIETGDQVLRTLTGATQEAPSYAAPSAESEDGTGTPGVLIDRQV